MTLIKELIEIPETVQRGDFGLRLAEDSTRPDVVLGNYVVTPELKLCFDDALSFVRSAIDSRTSKASYLHGSFASGKSHFMAVLHLILQGNPTARSIPEIAPADALRKYSESSCQLFRRRWQARLMRNSRSLYPRPEDLVPSRARC